MRGSRKGFFVLLVVASGVGLGIGIPQAQAAGNGGADRALVVGYFPQWGIHKRFFVRSLIDQGAMGILDQINYSQGHIDQNSQCAIADAKADLNYYFSAEDSVDGTADAAEMALRGNFHQLQELKHLYPQVRVVISLEGNPSSFAVAARPENRFSFVASCMQTFIEGRFADGIESPGLFDGIDVDWEFPEEEDKDNFIALLAEFRRQLDAERPDLLLTVAMGDSGTAYRHLDLETASLFVDQVGVMNYDYGGPWSKRTGMVAPLFSSPRDIAHGGDVAETLQGYLNAGVPASKMLLGLPFYGYAWNHVSAVDHGLFQLGEPLHEDFPYSHIASVRDKYKVYRDSDSMAPWLFDGSTFWTYDDELSIATKLDYARRLGLRGVMIWELSGDTADGKLMRTISGKLKAQSREAAN